jgi:hypothetical protein
MQIILTPEERVILEGQLADARAAYHALQTGTQARVVVDQNGERVEFTSANRQSLYAYIMSLQAQLGVCVTPRPLAPSMFVF